MEKGFKEYSNQRRTIPFILWFSLIEYAKDYIKEEHKIISHVDTKVRDAVLVDSINYLGKNSGINFTVYAKDLYENRRNIDANPQSLITELLKHYPKYIFEEGIVKSVLCNIHTNECTEFFSASDGALVLIDFINYISKRNNFDRTFTLNELYEKAKSQNYNREMEKLKAFLELTSEYSERLKNGETIDSIFQELAINNLLSHVSKDGIYYYNEYGKTITGTKTMSSSDIIRTETEIYAMAYAYAKMSGKKKKPKTQIIKQKIKEMSNKKL